MAYKFKTISEAEDYFEKNINTNSNNCNEEWESARDAWVSDLGCEIEEVDLEDRD